MPAIKFPNSPAVNETFTAPNGVTYQWTGTVWIVVAGGGQEAQITAPPLMATMEDYFVADAMALGNTPMTSANGNELVAANFTAQSPDNFIEFDVTVYVGGGNPVTGIAGLFVDNEVNCRAMGVSTTNQFWADIVRVHWIAKLPAGEHRYSVRVAGASAQIVINGTSNVGRTGGGYMRSGLLIREVGIGSKGPQGDRGIDGIPGTPGGGEWEVGDVRLTYRQAARSGWLFMDDTTIGHAASAAVHAGPEFEELYGVLWPIPAIEVVGGKGVDAANDWAAGKPLGLAKVLGRALAVAGTGADAGAPAGLLTPHPLATSMGSERVQTEGASSAAGINPQGGGWVFTDPHTHATWVIQPTTWLNAEIRFIGPTNTPPA